MIRLAEYGTCVCRGLYLFGYWWVNPVKINLSIYAMCFRFRVCLIFCYFFRNFLQNKLNYQSSRFMSHHLSSKGININTILDESLPIEIVCYVQVFERHKLLRGERFQTIFSFEESSSGNQSLHPNVITFDLISSRILGVGLFPFLRNQAMREIFISFYTMRFFFGEHGKQTI